MEKYAILKIGSRQYKVSEGQEVLIDRVETEKVEAQVLLMKDGDKVLVGKPFVDKVKVDIKVLVVEEKGEKVDVFKYKSKSRYRKHTGFRPKYTRILVEKLV